MKIIINQPRPTFAWDETPSEIFEDGLERVLAQHTRRSERDVAAFLREWRGTNLVTQLVEGDLTDDIYENT